MITSERKAKDDSIGGKEFSRVRRFDDEARKVRIFALNATNAVDIEKLEQQVKEHQEKRKLDEAYKKEEETREDMERERWKREDDELRKQRVETRSALEGFWMKQDQEFKERWKHKTAELVKGYVGIFPEKRYKFQEEEVLRDAEVTKRVSNVWNRQMDDHKQKSQEELEEKKDHDIQMDIARKRWERDYAKILEKLRSTNIDTANLNLQKYFEKCLRDKGVHDEEHLYEISKEFFDQFNTTSR